MATIKQLYGYRALEIAIKVEKATVNNALFAVGLIDNIHRSNYRKNKKETALADTNTVSGN